jgi:hypothetical protein
VGTPRRHAWRWSVEDGFALMSILDSLSGVVDSFRIPGGIEVERRSGTGVDSDGDPSGGPIQRFRIDPVVVQPATGRDLLRLPEGDRSRGSILIHSKRRLRVSLEGSGLASDVVLYSPGGEIPCRRYVVTTSADWHTVGGFHSVLATKEELA